MGYGIISATILLASGVVPSQVSASVHAAKLPTTCISGLSHILHRNVIWRLFIMLAIAGSLGLCLAVDHASMAALVWVMALAAAALVVAMALSWRPHWLRLLVPGVSRT